MARSEAELFALAAAWGDRLRGRASLQVPAHAGRLHPREEQWLTLELQKLARRSVRLETQDTTRAFVATVRETVDVWHAIASCPGFTGRENPVFWRRVVSHTYRRTHRRQHGCSDEFTFGDAFPRLRLFFEDRLAYETTDERAREEARHVEFVCREFFGLPDDEDGVRVPPSPEYLEAMAQLKPFVSRARYERVIPVAMDLPSWDTSHLYPAMARLLHDVRAAPAESRVARFRIEELSLDDMRVLFHDNAFESYQKWLQLPGVRISHWWWKSQSMDLDAMVPFSAVRAATGLDESVMACLQTLLVNRHTLSDQQFGGLCAALPTARSLRHVRFSELSRRHDWAWLAFALFHRDTKNSSWKELSVDMCHLDGDDLEVMREVRDVGLASLPAVVGPFSPRSHQGTTRVLVKADTVLQLFDASAGPIDLDHVMWLDVIGERSDSQLGVVLSAYGLGFINASAVIQYDTMPPQRAASLTHFRAMVMTCSPPQLRDWVAMIGSTTLQLVEVIDHVALPAVVVGSILKSCPSLTSLNVTQDGSLWTHSIPQSVRLWPQLQTLNVSSSSADHAVSLLRLMSSGRAGPLPGLRQLRVDITLPDDDYTTTGAEEASLRRVAVAAGDLLRRVRTITHVNLHGVTPARGRGEIQTLTYEQYRGTVLSTMQLDEAALDTTSDARIALLSVLDWHQREKKLPSLTPDLLRIVFGFAGREVRNAWIEL